MREINEAITAQNHKRIYQTLEMMEAFADDKWFRERVGLCSDSLISSLHFALMNKDSGIYKCSICGSSNDVFSSKIFLCVDKFVCRKCVFDESVKDKDTESYTKKVSDALKECVLLMLF